MPRQDSPFEVLEMITDNAYKVDLLGDYGVSAMFNIADLSLYLEDNYLSNLSLIPPNKRRMMEVHLASSIRIFGMVKVITIHKSQVKILLTFCKSTRQEVLDSTPRIHPILCMLFHRPFGGLSPCFLADKILRKYASKACKEVRDPFLLRG